MSNKYTRYMDGLSLSKEAEERIIKNAVKADDRYRKKRSSGFNRTLGFIIVAASFVLIVAGAFILRFPGKKINEGGQSSNMMTGNPMVEYDSLEKMEKAVDFNVRKLTKLPFSVENERYAVYSGKMSEVTYEGKNGSLTMRASKKTDEDISGVYEEFTDIRKMEIAGMEVTLKGSEDGFVLASWDHDGLSECIYSEKAYSIQEWEVIIGGVS